MKSESMFQPIHAYFLNVSFSAVVLSAFIYGWPAPVAIAFSLASLLFLGIGIGMTICDLVVEHQGRES